MNAGAWPDGFYGAPSTAAVTFTLDEEERWVVLLDLPWKEHGLLVGTFGGLPEAVAFVYGPGAFRCPRCGIASLNRHDAAERYCGRCHRFEVGP